MFGVGPRSVAWVRSFLTGRSQKVRIGNEVSSARRVVTGVPQGGVLSPLIFVLFVSDLQDWLHHSSAPTYADDTSTGTHGKTAQETIEKNGSGCKTCATIYGLKWSGGKCQENLLSSAKQ